jgi:hypothetical protein
MQISPEIELIGEKNFKNACNTMSESAYGMLPRAFVLVVSRKSKQKISLELVLCRK